MAAPVKTERQSQNGPFTLPSIATMTQGMGNEKSPKHSHSAGDMMRDSGMWSMQSPSKRKLNRLGLRCRDEFIPSPLSSTLHITLTFVVRFINNLERHLLLLIQQQRTPTSDHPELGRITQTFLFSICHVSRYSCFGASLEPASTREHLALQAPVTFGKC